MAFSGRSERFLETLDIPSDYQSDVRDYLSKLKTVADLEEEEEFEGGFTDIDSFADAGEYARDFLEVDEDFSLRKAAKWYGAYRAANYAVAGVVAAVYFGGAAIGTALGIGGAAAGGTAATVGGTAATVGGTAATVGGTAGGGVLTGLGTFWAGLTGAQKIAAVSGAVTIGQRALSTFRKNSQGEDQEEFAQNKSEAIRGKLVNRVALTADQLAQNFFIGAEKIRTDIVKLEIELDQRERQLEFSSDKQLLTLERQRINAQRDKEILAITTDSTIYSTNKQIEEATYATKLVYANYNNSKEVISAYRESSIIAAQNSNLRAYGQGQAAWSNVFSATQATVGGESVTEQSNRRINKSSEAIISLLNTQDQVYQRSSEYKNNLTNLLLKAGDDRYKLDSKFKSDIYSLNSRIGSAGNTIDTTLKRFGTTNSAITLFLSNVEKQGDLVKENLIQGKEDLESIYENALKSVSFQRDQLLDNLNRQTEFSFNQFETDYIRGDRLGQSYIGGSYDLQGVAKYATGLYELTQSGLEDDFTTQRIGNRPPTRTSIGNGNPTNQKIGEYYG